MPLHYIATHISVILDFVYDSDPPLNHTSFTPLFTPGEPPLMREPPLRALLLITINPSPILKRKKTPPGQVPEPIDPHAIDMRLDAGTVQ